MFENISPVTADAILGLAAEFRADTRANKVDLGVGVYKDAEGRTPVLRAVAQAEQRRLDRQTTKSYVGGRGDAGFNQAMQALVLGEHPAGGEDRIRTLQAPGGTGALRIGAELIKRCRNDAVVWVPDPTWANHLPLLSGAGLATKTYPYYDFHSHGLRFEAMLETLDTAESGDIVLLHGCCHNPTGMDLDQQQWQAVSALCARRGLFPFIDLAYQGLGAGLDEDAAGVRMLASDLPELLVAASCSKNFGLYRERTGALSILSAETAQSEAALSHALQAARAIYSMPPAHGAEVVRLILEDDALRADWVRELGEMRQRINALRARLGEALTSAGVGWDCSYLERQNGMFSFLDVTPEQADRLKDEFGVYLVRSGRINVAGLNDDNLEPVARAVARVVSG